MSLLPDIDIPQITIQVTSENASARELENTMVAPVRRALLQVSGLNEMRSETRDGSGVIRLSFDFGTDTDLAFIEVNEKIDAAMNSLPKDAVRPKAVKASATDIPVFYLNMTLKSDRPYAETDEQGFPQNVRAGGQRGEKTHRAAPTGSHGGCHGHSRTGAATGSRHGKDVGRGTDGSRSGERACREQCGARKHVGKRRILRIQHPHRLVAPHAGRCGEYLFP